MYDNVDFILFRICLFFWGGGGGGLFACRLTVILKNHVSFKTLMPELHALRKGRDVYNFVNNSPVEKNNRTLPKIQ